MNSEHSTDNIASHSGEVLPLLLFFHLSHYVKSYLNLLLGWLLGGAHRPATLLSGDEAASAHALGGHQGPRMQDSDSVML